jgi:hypothetical protein
MFEKKYRSIEDVLHALSISLLEIMIMIHLSY